MEHTPESIPARTNDREPPDVRLVGGRNKVERIAQQSKGLVDDIKEWVELRIELVKVEIQEQVDTLKDQVRSVAIFGVLAAVGALFLLLTVAFGLGWWLGHPFWGFLIVSVLLLGAAGVVYKVKLADRGKKEVQVTAPSRSAS